MTHRTIEGFFHPKTVVIVGASTVENSTGWAMANQAKKTFNTDGLYFVNPRGGELFGLKLYKKIEEIPIDQIDLAIIAIRADFTPNTVEDLAVKKKCFYQVIISGGFAEANEEGKKFQNTLVNLCQKYGIRIIGPNCVGIYSPAENIDCLFIEGVNAVRPVPGNLSLATQSGGFGMCMFNELNAFSHSMPWFGRLVSLGNSCNVCEADFMEFFENDSRTHVVTMYLEGFKQAPRFLYSARRAVLQGKPVLIVKAGRNAEGALASSSHSASLAADDFVTDELFKQYGIIRCNGWRDMYRLYSTGFLCSRPFLIKEIPYNPPLEHLKKPIIGNRVFILTNGGGQGVQLCDALEQFGLALAKPKLENFAKLNFPSFFIINNPLDLTGSGTADHFARSLKVINDDPNVDAIIVNIVSVVSMIHGKQLREICEDIVENFGKNAEEQRTGCFITSNEELIKLIEGKEKMENVLTKRKIKPLFMTMIGPESSDKTYCLERLLSGGIPLFSSEIDTIQSLSALYHFQTYRERTISGFQQEQAQQKEKESKDQPHDLSKKKVLSPLFSCSPSTTSMPVSADKMEVIPDTSIYYSSAVKKQIKSILATVPKSDASSQALLEHDARKLLGLINVPVQRYVLAKTGEEASSFYDKLIKIAPLTIPKCVVKIVSKDVLHKSDEGGVVVGVGSGKSRSENEKSNNNEVGEVVDEMINRFRSKGKEVTGVIVSEMVPPKYRPRPEWDNILKTAAQEPSFKLPPTVPSNKYIELIVGMNTDPTFGKVLIIGMGGVLVEVNKDVAIGLCPLMKFEALNMIDRLKSQKILNGYRGLPAINRNKLADLMISLSQFAIEFSDQIDSFDFNPVIAGDNDELWVVDARIMVKT